MRSQFLTILCVLSFLSCGWGLFDSTVSFLRTDAAAETPYIKRNLSPEEKARQSKEYYEDRSSGDVPLPVDPTEVRSLAVAQFVYALITLIGAVFMFQLRRVGFWIYVAGVIVGFILPVAMGGFGALNASFGAFFSLIFAGLYWISLKEMH